MGNFYSKCRQLYSHSPTLSMMALAAFLYIYVFHGLPQIWRKQLQDRRKNPWGLGVGRKVCGIVGLKNFGNTCYFNSCIQALAACTMFCAWIERRNLMNDIRQNRMQDGTDDNANELENDEGALEHLPFPVIAALHEAFSLINAKTVSRDPCLSEMIPSKLICAFTKHNVEAVKRKRMRKFVLNSHEEQDTHEAFNYILETIADECSNISKIYHSSTNLVLSDSICVEQDMETDKENEAPAFCKLTRKVPPVVGTSRDSDPVKPDEVECDEEEELTFPATAHNEPGTTHLTRPRPTRAQRSYHFIRPTGSGDSIFKGKRSNKDWLGGSIVSRTEIHEADIKEDTLMTQNISFDGTLGVKLVCMACNTKNPTSLDKFNCLTVTFPRDLRLGYPIKLEDLLLHSLRPTQVHSVNCDGCLKRFGRPTTSSFVKYTAIGRMPPTLCVHVNRSEWTNDGICIKRNEFVRFPLYLNLHNFKRISDLMNQNPTMQGVPTYGEIIKLVESKPDKERAVQEFDYLLKAVICHSGGSADSGHFTTYRQSCAPNAIGQGWYFISDCQISAASLAEVMSCKAYMLFYEKKVPVSVLPSVFDITSKFK